MHPNATLFLCSEKNLTLYSAIFFFMMNIIFCNVTEMESVTKLVLLENNIGRHDVHFFKKILVKFKLLIVLADETFLSFVRDGTSIILSDDVGQLYILNTGQGESQMDAKYDQVLMHFVSPFLQDQDPLHFKCNGEEQVP